jgi:L-threonylcarbamoyladenylate synthase
VKKAFEKDIENCLRALLVGGSILYPTDTVWGLGCDATDEAAVQKIIQIKNRPAAKSFVVLVNNVEMLRRYVSTPDESIFRYLAEVKKPTTVVYSQAKGLAESVMASDFSVAIRICKDEFCQDLIQQFGKPLLSTSANKSGEPAPKIFKEVSPEIAQAVDYTVYYRRDDEQQAAPSAIVKWENGKIVVIRE